MDTRTIALALAALILAGSACDKRSRHRSGALSGAGERTRADTLVLYVAASLTTAMTSLTDSVARTGTVVERESGASIEHARKLTELGRIPDVLALADYDVFPKLLMPRFVDWYAEFARNRMVIAYTGHSRHAAELTAMSWPRVLAMRDVQVGRTDPNLAPVGYRTLLMLELAERWYHEPGLAARLLANAPLRNVRPDAAQLAALLETGELDYIYDYESVAITRGFHYLRLPPEIDLSDPNRAKEYASVSVRIASGRPGSGDSVSVPGEPIVFAVAIPKDAPHPRAATRFAAVLLSRNGRAMLRAAHVDALEQPVLVGTAIPPEVRAAAGH